ncbi:MAG TPA: MBL fold metallo-hydrolase RNA specificity domain-containing protein, partial [Acidimicrobiia bacterium]|nr:MBL fold metallo-hydrolase RNA specificity domain-containing protein [Acidimicrobiia bacterium]
AATFRATDGLVLAVWSAQNVDRLVTLYRAALRADRDLVVDLYTASVARATGNPNIPRPDPDWPRVHVYLPHWQRRRIVEREAFERVDAVKAQRIYEEHLAADPGRYVLNFSRSSGGRLAEAGALQGARAVWSLWTGYLGDPSGVALRAFLDRHHIPLEVHHTSGHASMRDLQRLARAVAPRRLVPIHSLRRAPLRRPVRPCRRPGRRRLVGRLRVHTPTPPVRYQPRAGTRWPPRDVIRGARPIAAVGSPRMLRTGTPAWLSPYK